MASRDNILRGHNSEPTDDYLASIGEHAPHGGKLTVGYVAGLDATLRKSLDLIADLHARLDRLEGKKP